MSIADLMQLPREQHNLEWLKQMLQFAVELEISTLPPYLSGLWTIKQEPGTGSNGPVSELIQSVAQEEMVHLGLACNMLTAIGGAPSIYTPFQRRSIKYPGPSPGGVRPQLTVYLAGLSKQYVHDVYMQIEYPEQGPVTLFAGNYYPTIGAFYDTILDTFRTLNPSLSLDNQLAACFGQKDLPCPEDMLQVFTVSTLADVEEAITEIKEQGEGSSTSPESPDFGTEPVTGKIEFAHYYKYAEIYNDHELLQAGGKWVYQGASLPFPTVIPVNEIPASGYKNAPADVQVAIRKFNQTFAQLLTGLETAWTQGSEDQLQDAINIMLNLFPAAQAILGHKMPDGSYYGPTFDVNDVSPGG